MHICILPFINFNKHYLVHLYDWSDRLVCPARAPCGFHCHSRWETGISAEGHIRIRQDSNNSTYSTLQSTTQTIERNLEEQFTLISVCSSHSRVSIECQGEYFFQCLMVKNLEVIKNPQWDLHTKIEAWCHNLCWGNLYFPICMKIM